MVKIVVNEPSGSVFEKTLVKLFKEHAFLIPAWCRVLYISTATDSEVAGTCNPVMHNGFAVISIPEPTDSSDTPFSLRDTVLHEIAHLYTYPDTRWVIVTLADLDIGEDVYKVFKSALMDRHESCNDALTELFTKVVISMAKKCDTKKGSAKPFPPKKGK